ncbi:ATP-binding protein [Patescibacteria group bacterium]|nr:ATP-binding protein [Patescibacteria group bacterium]
MFKKPSTIKVKVDKSHLFTLGEKMYRESIEFIRELVNNAYDADATAIQIAITNDQITVEDDGSGMNEKGLEQFFTIGSEEKRIRSISPRFGRKRIGQFGIGKFSALALADQFIVQSVKGKYKYSVIFNRANWKNDSNWELPIKTEESSPLDKEGTKIILDNLTKKISINEVEKYLKQSVPLRAKKFNLYLNNKKITAKTVAGKIFPLRIKTVYGLIEGQIILALNSGDVDEPGVECRVKQVFIKRDLFGLDKKYHQGYQRICGYINADFLPLISSRSDFIIDDPKYKLFCQIITAELDKILQDLKKQKENKNIQKITKELQQTMQQIKQALQLNPDFVPQGRAIARLKKGGRKKIAASALMAQNKNTGNKTAESSAETKQHKQEDIDKTKKDEEQEKIEAKPLVMKRIRLQKFGVTCSIVSLGVGGPETISQGNAIYINLDHPLYQSSGKNRDLLNRHLLRLITQEIVLMKKLKITARDAFDWQSKLLTDALNLD